MRVGPRRLDLGGALHELGALRLLVLRLGVAAIRDEIVPRRLSVLHRGVRGAEVSDLVGRRGLDGVAQESRQLRGRDPDLQERVRDLLGLALRVLGVLALRGLAVGLDGFLPDVSGRCSRIRLRRTRAAIDACFIASSVSVTGTT